MMMMMMMMTVEAEHRWRWSDGNIEEVERCLSLTASPLDKQPQTQQAHQALIKAKYRPRVAAPSGTQKNTQKTHVTLTSDLW